MSAKVLWIEEEPDSLPWEHLIVEARGWTITEAANAEEGLSMLNSTRFSAVFVDLILPLDVYHAQRGEVDTEVGVRLVACIRDAGREGRTPPDVSVIVISAVVSPGQKAQVYEHLESPHDYLEKPVGEQQFLDAMDRLSARIECR